MKFVLVLLAFALSPAFAWCQFALPDVQSYSGGVALDPTSGKRSPPTSFPQATASAAEQRLDEAVADANAAVGKAQDEADRLAEADPDCQTLIHDLDDAKARLEAAESDDDRLQAAADKVAAASRLSGFLSKRISTDSKVIEAQKQLSLATDAREKYFTTREYGSVAEIMNVVPAINWLAELDHDVDKYLWADQFFNKINDDLDRLVNGHSASLSVHADHIDDQVTGNVIIGMDTKSLLVGKEDTLNNLHVRTYVVMPQDAQVNKDFSVQGTIHARIEHQVRDAQDLFLLDVILTDCTILDSPNSSGPKFPTANRANQDNVLWSGSGFLVSQDGMILTNRHMVMDEDHPQILPSLNVYLAQMEQPCPAKIVAIDDDQDLALIRISLPGATPFIHLATSNFPNPGARCSILGFPALNGLELGSDLKITQGIITDVDSGKSENDWAIKGRDLLMDAKANPGNSGGPIMDRNGNAMGIISAKTTADTMHESYNIGISAGHIRDFLTQHKFDAPINKSDPEVMDDEEIFKKSKDAVVRIEATGG